MLHSNKPPIAPAPSLPEIINSILTNFFEYTVPNFSVGVWLEVKNCFLTPTEQIETVKLLSPSSN